MSIDHDKIRQTAARWLDEGRRVSCATVIRTWRSSPRPAGSRMIIDDHGRFSGSVSGGCVETSVIQAAIESIETGRPRCLEFGVTNEAAWEVGLPCGGKMEVFVGPLDAEINRRLLTAREGRSILVLRTDLASGEERLLDPRGLPDDLPAVERELIESNAGRELREVVGQGADRVFLETIGPPVRLILVGAVHLGQAVAELGRVAGFEITVVDPRRAFATAERFPDVPVIAKWPAEALAEIGLDRRTAVVTLAHDAKIDEPALAAALRSDCFYIGALGGRKNQAARRKRLSEAGFDEASLGRIHGPVGLDIGARTTPEIAIAIVGQIIQLWRGGTAD